MAAFAAGFPSSPKPGEEYTNPSSGITYKWDDSNEVWNVVSTPGSGGGGGGGSDVDKNYVDTVVGAEATARSDKDDDLQRQINSIGSGGGTPPGGGGNPDAATKVELQAETDARIQGDLDIRTEGAAALQGEATTRLEEDGKLKDAIDANAQESADLSGRVDSLEAGGGGGAKDLVDAEAAARESADAALQDLISAETTNREAADSALSTRVDTAEADIDALEENFEKAVIGLGEAGDKLEIELTNYATTEKVDAVEDALQAADKDLQDAVDAKQPKGDYLTEADLDGIEVDYDDSELRDEISRLESELEHEKAERTTEVRAIAALGIADAAGLKALADKGSETSEDLSNQIEEVDGRLGQEIQDLKEHFDEIIEDLGDVDGDKIEIDLEGYAKADHKHDAGDITSGKFNPDRYNFGTVEGSVAEGNHRHDWQMFRQGVNAVASGWSLTDGGAAHLKGLSEAAKAAVTKAMADQGVDNPALLNMSEVVLPADVIRGTDNTYITVLDGQMGLHNVATSSEPSDAASVAYTNNKLNGKSDKSHSHSNYSSTSHNHNSTYSTLDHGHGGYAKNSGDKRVTFSVEGNNLYVTWA